MSDEQDELVESALASVVVFDDADGPTPQAEALGKYVLSLPRHLQPQQDLSQVSTMRLLDELRRRVLGGELSDD